jgi:hypothetical protein
MVPRFAMFGTENEKLIVSGASLAFAPLLKPASYRWAWSMMCNNDGFVTFEDFRDFCLSFEHRHARLKKLTLSEGDLVHLEQIREDGIWNGFCKLWSSDNGYLNKGVWFSSGAWLKGELITKNRKRVGDDDHYEGIFPAECVEIIKVKVFSESWLTLGRYLLNPESRYVRLMLQDSYQRTMRLRQVKRDPAVFRKYLDGSLHLLLQWMRCLTLQLSILLLFFMTEPGHSQTIQATVWKLVQDHTWKSTRQTHQIVLQLYHISSTLHTSVAKHAYPIVQRFRFPLVVGDVTPSEFESAGKSFASGSRFFSCGSANLFETW